METRVPAGMPAADSRPCMLVGVAAAATAASRPAATSAAVSATDTDDGAAAAGSVDTASKPPLALPRLAR
jgi:hypothetical protein